MREDRIHALAQRAAGLKTTIPVNKNFEMTGTPYSPVRPDSRTMNTPAQPVTRNPGINPNGMYSGSKTTQPQITPQRTASTVAKTQGVIPPTGMRPSQPQATAPSSQSYFDQISTTYGGDPFRFIRENKDVKRANFGEGKGAVYSIQGLKNELATNPNLSLDDLVIEMSDGTKFKASGLGSFVLDPSKTANPYDSNATGTFVSNKQTTTKPDFFTTKPPVVKDPNIHPPADRGKPPETTVQTTPTPYTPTPYTPPQRQELSYTDALAQAQQQLDPVYQRAIQDIRSQQFSQGQQSGEIAANRGLGHSGLAADAMNKLAISANQQIGNAAMQRASQSAEMARAIQEGDFARALAIRQQGFNEYMGQNNVNMDAARFNYGQYRDTVGDRYRDQDNQFRQDQFNWQKQTGESDQAYRERVFSQQMAQQQWQNNFQQGQFDQSQLESNRGYDMQRALAMLQSGGMSYDDFIRLMGGLR